MHRWASLPLLCLAACVNQVVEWPEEGDLRSAATDRGSSADLSDTESGLFPKTRQLGDGADDENDSTAPAQDDENTTGGWGSQDEATAVDEPEDTEPTDCDGNFCDWPADWVAMEHEVLARVNEIRLAGATCADDVYPPVAEVDWNEELANAARGHSQDMGDQGYFAHDSLDGRSPWERMRDASFFGSPVAENIAAGSSTAAAVVNSWMNSPGHCRNIMSSRATVLGVGYAYVAGSPWGHYWTQAFGAQ